MSFSRTAWQDNAGLYKTILEMPFNQELLAGTLPQETFKRYMIQDAHYLEGFARALAAAAAKGTTAEHIVEFSGAAREAIVVERALHETYFRQFGVSAEDFAGTEPTPDCALYVNTLISWAFLAPYEVLLAGLLPCFWIYREVGVHIHGNTPDDNPYQAWIDTYAGEDFEAAVSRVIAITDQVAEAASPAHLTQMHQAFRRAAQLEYMFWDSAYHGRGWPV